MDSSGQLHAPVALTLERRLQYPMDEKVGGVTFSVSSGNLTSDPTPPPPTTQNSDLKSCVGSGSFRFSDKTGACDSHRI
jgi:hypothetical protein